LAKLKGSRRWAAISLIVSSKSRKQRYPVVFSYILAFGRKI
jgi:hypothetical protein